MDDDSTGTLIAFIFTILFLIGIFCPVSGVVYRIVYDLRPININVFFGYYRLLQIKKRPY